MTSSPMRAALLLAPVMLIASPGKAANVTLSGTLTNSCILSLSVPGALAASSDGTTLTSETSGGLPATMALIALGGQPTVNFSAPAVSGPSGSTGGATTQIRYTSLQGASQAYTSGASSRIGGALLDTFTIHGRVSNTSGFTAGTYTVTTVATCQQ